MLVVFYNNKYIFDFSDFLLPQTPGATYMIHMTNSLNYCIFFLLFLTKSLLFYDQIIFFLMWCILRLSRVKDFFKDLFYDFNPCSAEYLRLFFAPQLNI